MYCKNQEAQDRADAWRMKVDAMTQSEREWLICERGSILSDEELEEIDRRFNSPTGDIIQSIMARFPRVYRKRDGTPLKQRPWSKRTTKKKEKGKPTAAMESKQAGESWKEYDSHLAVMVDEIIEKHEIRRHKNEQGIPR